MPKVERRGEAVPRPVRAPPSLPGPLGWWRSGPRARGPWAAAEGSGAGWREAAEGPVSPPHTHQPEQPTRAPEVSGLETLYSWLEPTGDAQTSEGPRDSRSGKPAPFDRCRGGVGPTRLGRRREKKERKKE